MPLLRLHHGKTGHPQTVLIFFPVLGAFA